MQLAAAVLRASPADSALDNQSLKPTVSRLMKLHDDFVGEGIALWSFLDHLVTACPDS